jgi:hypothetical protein
VLCCNHQQHSLTFASHNNGNRDGKHSPPPTPSGNITRETFAAATCLAAINNQTYGDTKHRSSASRTAANAAKINVFFPQNAFCAVQQPQQVIIADYS